MKRDNLREDDMLAVYGVYLESKGFKLFSISGNQQGRYWYNIDEYRKGPDIVAVKGDMILIGEGKLRSRDLFLSNTKGVSDYEAIKYLLDSPKAYSQLMHKIEDSCKKVGMVFPEQGFIKGIIVGGNPFDNLLSLIDDLRVGYVYVDMEKGIVKEKL